MGWVTFWSKKDSQTLDLNGSGMEKFHATQEFSFMFLVDCQKCTIGCHSTQNWIQVRFFNPMRQLINNFTFGSKHSAAWVQGWADFRKKSNFTTDRKNGRRGKLLQGKRLLRRTLLLKDYFVEFIFHQNVIKHIWWLKRSMAPLTRLLRLQLFMDHFPN